MPRQSDIDFKSFITAIGKLIDARAKTTEVIMRAELASKEDIKDMVRMSDIKDMVRKKDIENMATKDDIKDMVRKEDIKNMATKQDIASLREKPDETKALQREVRELRKRLDHIEEELMGIRSKN